MDELHKANEKGMSAKAKFDAKEMGLAKQLIDTLASPFKPEIYKDEYRENVERLIQQKQKGGTITPVKQPKIAPGVNILEALRQSLRRSSNKPGMKSRSNSKPAKAA